MIAIHIPVYTWIYCAPAIFDPNLVVDISTPTVLITVDIKLTSIITQSNMANHKLVPTTTNAFGPRLGDNSRDMF